MRETQQIKTQRLEIESELVSLRQALVADKDGSNAGSIDARFIQLTNTVLNDMPVTVLKQWLTRILLARLRPGQMEVPLAEYEEELRSYNNRKVCGLVFGTGDLAYNCRNCQADPTCVMCQDCFNDSDHAGHDVTFHKTAPGGCCDCGDDEAWAKTGFCSRHGGGGETEAGGRPSDPRDLLPTELRTQAKLVFEQIIAYIGSTIADIIYSFAQTGASYDINQSDSHNNNQSSGKSKSVTYHVIVHNDDVHAEEYVSQSLSTSSVIKGSGQDPKELTKKIGTEGRAAVWSGGGTDHRKHLKHARAAAKHFVSRQLLTSISKSAQLHRERRSIICTEWLESFVDMSDGLARSVCRAMIEAPVRSARDAGGAWFAEHCPKWPELPPPMAFHINEESNSYSNGSIDGESASDGDEWLTVSHGKSPVFLDDLVRFNPLLPKRFVNAIHQLLLHLLVDLEFKTAFSYAFVQGYNGNVIATGSGFGTSSDSVLQFAVQLLTVPSVVKWLTRTYERLAIKDRNSGGEDSKATSTPPLDAIFLNGILVSLSPDSYDPGAVLSKSRGVVNLGKGVDLEGRDVLSRRYNAYVTNYEYLLAQGCAPLLSIKGGGDTDTPARMDSSSLRHLLDVLKLIHNMDPQRRHTGPDHVLWENQTWKPAFYLDSSVSTLVRACAVQLAKSVALELPLVDADTRALAVRHIISACYSRIYQAENQDVVSKQYTVKRIATMALGTYKVNVANMANGSPASFHNVLHRFLALFLVQLAATCESTAQGSESYVFDMAAPFAGFQSDEDFNVRIFVEQPMRTLVMCAQVEAGLWKRNGFTQQLQTSNYTSNLFSAMYQLDVLVMQTVSCVLSPGELMTYMLNRFGLITWWFIDHRSDLKLYDPEAFGMAQLYLNKRRTKSPRDFVMNMPEAQQVFHLKELNSNCSAMAVEVLRLIAVMVTYVPQRDPSRPEDDMAAGRALVRKAIIHKLAESTLCSFSNVSEFVHSLRLLVAPQQGAEGGNNTSSASSNMLPTATSKDIETVLEDVANTVPTSTGTVAYQLKDECWDEFDPLSWFLSREEQQRAVENKTKAKEQTARTAAKEAASLGKGKASKKKGVVVPMPIVCAPPTPVLGSYARARGLIYSPAIVAVLQVVLGDAVAANDDLFSKGALACSRIRLLGSGGSLHSNVGADAVTAADAVLQTKTEDVEVVCWTEMDVERARARTSVTLVLTAIHLLTLGLQAVNQPDVSPQMRASFYAALAAPKFPPNKSPTEVTLHPRHFSVIEHLLALRGYSADSERLARDSDGDKAEFDTRCAVEWCIQHVDKHNTDAAARDMIKTVKEVHACVEAAKRAEDKKGNGGKKKKKKKGNKAGRMERAKAAQKAAMMRMQKAQDNAFQDVNELDETPGASAGGGDGATDELMDVDGVVKDRSTTFLGGEDADDIPMDEQDGDDNAEKAVHECSLCHEMDSGLERPMAFVAFAQRSTWGSSLPVSAAGSYVDPSSSQSRKPAGWEAPTWLFDAPPSLSSPQARASRTSSVSRVRGLSLGVARARALTGGGGAAAASAMGNGHNQNVGASNGSVAGGSNVEAWSAEGASIGEGEEQEQEELLDWGLGGEGAGVMQEEETEEYDEDDGFVLDGFVIDDGEEVEEQAEEQEGGLRHIPHRDTDDSDGEEDAFSIAHLSGEEDDEAEGGATAMDTELPPHSEDEEDNLNQDVYRDDEDSLLTSAMSRQPRRNSVNRNLRNGLVGSELALESLDTVPRASSVFGAMRSHVHVSFCSHVLHVDCMDTYYKTLGQSANSRHGQRQIISVEKLEFLCPACKRASNTLVPVDPRANTSAKGDGEEMPSSLAEVPVSALPATASMGSVAIMAAANAASANGAASVPHNHRARLSSSETMGDSLGCCGSCASGVNVDPSNWARWLHPFEEDSANESNESNGYISEARGHGLGTGSDASLEGLVGELGYPTLDFHADNIAKASATLDLEAAGEERGVSIQSLRRLLTRLYSVHSHGGFEGEEDTAKGADLLLQETVLGGWDSLWFTLMCEAQSALDSAYAEDNISEMLVDDNNQTREEATALSLEVLGKVVSCCNRYSLQWVGLMLNMLMSGPRLLGPNVQDNLENVDGSMSTFAMVNDAVNGPVKEKKRRRIRPHVVTRRLRHLLGATHLRVSSRLKRASGTHGAPAAIAAAASSSATASIGTDDDSTDGFGAFAWSVFDMRVKHPLMKMLVTGIATDEGGADVGTAGGMSRLRGGSQGGGSNGDVGEVPRGAYGVGGPPVDLRSTLRVPPAGGATANNSSPENEAHNRSSRSGSVASMGSSTGGYGIGSNNSNAEDTDLSPLRFSLLDWLCDTTMATEQMPFFQVAVDPKERVEHHKMRFRYGVAEDGLEISKATLDMLDNAGASGSDTCLPNLPCSSAPSGNARGGGAAGGGTLADTIVPWTYEVRVDVKDLPGLRVIPCRNNALCVMKVDPSGRLARAASPQRVRPGDFIVAVDETSVDELNIRQIVRRMVVKGKAGALGGSSSGHTQNGASTAGASGGSLRSHLRRGSYRKTVGSGQVTLLFARYAHVGALLDVTDPFMLLVTLFNTMSAPFTGESGTESGDTCVDAYSMAARTSALVGVVKALTSAVWTPAASGAGANRGRSESSAKYPSKDRRTSKTSPTTKRTRSRSRSNSKQRASSWSAAANGSASYASVSVVKKGGIGGVSSNVTEAVGVLAHVVQSALIEQYGTNMLRYLSVPSDVVLEQIALGVLLPFLNQAALLFSLAFGGQWRDLRMLKSSSKAANVLDLLLEHFGLGDLRRFVQNELVQRRVVTWVKAWSRANPNALATSTVRLSKLHATMPEVRFNLISLPQAYDTLYSELVSQSKCPTTGKPIKDPALCLRCSAVVCAGGKCCRRRDIGPVCQHVYSCTGDSGAVLLLNIAQVLLVRGPYTVVMNAPYVDAHGEHDPGMRRGRPLQLDTKQFEALRRSCMGHGLGPTVSRMRNSAETVIYCSYY